MALEWEECGPPQASTLRATVRLERSRHRSEGRPTPVCADDFSVGRGTSAASSSALTQGALRNGWFSAVRRCSQTPRGTGVPSGRTQGERSSQTPPHLLFALGNVERTGEGDSGTGGAQGSDYDATIYAPQPAALDGAIRLLDERQSKLGGGSLGEAGSTETVNSSR
jgi:hypothetical protein